MKTLCLKELTGEEFQEAMNLLEKMGAFPAEVYTATADFVHPNIAGSKEEIFKQIEGLKKTDKG